MGWEGGRGGAGWLLVSTRAEGQAAGRAWGWCVAQQ